MEYNSDFKYDLKVGQVKEKELANILQNEKIEVKTDLQAHKTGNIFIEYESRGKPSGIATSEAKYYCIAIQETFIILPSTHLKKLCRIHLNTNRDRKGGDSNSSKGILLPVKNLYQYKNYL
tara:strand:- start:133 stop:495 length:363 start_codon:yes stop_codon:yes gene_type:complete